MIALRVILLIIHIVSAALWLGPTLGITRNLKRAIPAGQEAFRVGLADYKYRGMLSMFGGIGIIATGLSLLFLAGGFKVMPPQFHAALGLAIVAAVHASIFGRFEKQLLAAVERYNDNGKADGLAIVKKLSMHMGISKTLWLAAAVMMFIPR